MSDHTGAGGDIYIKTLPDRVYIQGSRCVWRGLWKKRSEQSKAEGVEAAVSACARRAAPAAVTTWRRQPLQKVHVSDLIGQRGRWTLCD